MDVGSGVSGEAGGAAGTRSGRGEEPGHGARAAPGRDTACRVLTRGSVCCTRVCALPSRRAHTPGPPRPRHCRERSELARPRFACQVKGHARVHGPEIRGLPPLLRVHGLRGPGLGVQPPSCPRGGFGAGRSAAGHADPTPRPLTPRSAPFLLSTSAASGSFSPERRRRQSWGFRVLRGAHGPRHASRSRRRVRLAPGRGFLAPPPRADRTASWRAADLPPAHARAADRPPQGETQPGSGRAGGPRQPQHRLGRGRCRGCCHAGSHGTRARFRASSAGQSMFRVYV